MTKKIETLHGKLNAIQTGIKVHKGRMNDFGNYRYRSAEDILEALKPYLDRYNLILTISEETRELGGYLFVHTTAELRDEDGNTHKTTSQAGIDPEKRGMDIGQAFGASSSYSKKYALGNMFLLDDTKDADATSNPKEVEKPAKATKKKMTKKVMELMEAAIEGGNKAQVKARMGSYTMTKVQRDKLETLLA